MPPVTIHCVRHAQGFHNISVANHAIHDPMLTPLGEEQCKALQAKFPFMDRVDAVVASPLKRTMYTALLSFTPAINDKKLQVYALPELQETSDLPCDTGSDAVVLKQEFKGQPVDFTYLDTRPAYGWTNKTGKWAATASAIDERARATREWLYSRPEKEIVVVTHGGFLHYLTDDWNDTHKMDGTPSAGKFLHQHHHHHRRRSDASPPPVVPLRRSHTRSRSESRSRVPPPLPLRPYHDLYHISDKPSPQSTPPHQNKQQQQHHHHHSQLHSYNHPGTGWANTEYRSYNIGSTKTGQIRLVETAQSRSRRSGDEKPLSKEEQTNLQRADQKQKAEQEKAYQKVSDIQTKV
jgi:broad specificity phosphatase PhoE